MENNSEYGRMMTRMMRIMMKRMKGDSADDDDDDVDTRGMERDEEEDGRGQ